MSQTIPDGSCGGSESHTDRMRRNPVAGDLVVVRGECPLLAGWVGRSVSPMLDLSCRAASRSLTVGNGEVQMATSVAQREAASTRRCAVRGDSPAPAANLTAPGVTDWAVQRPQITKLIAPGTRQLRPDAVSRAKLVEAARSSGCRLVAVTAPAGYGKSTFLAEWAAAEDRPVAWVSLDRYDDDPAMLAASLASACCRAGLGGADLVADKGGGPGWVLGRAAPRLAAALRASPVPFVLMLDDLHELQSSGCHDVLGLVISAIPDGSQLAAAS